MSATFWKVFELAISVWENILLLEFCMDFMQQKPKGKKGKIGASGRKRLRFRKPRHPYLHPVRLGVRLRIRMYFRLPRRGARGNGKTAAKDGRIQRHDSL